MQSNDNPLYTTKDFYGDKMTASRGNTAGGMFKDPQAQIANSRTGFQFPSEQANYAGRPMAAAET
jgi:hypothetical protein